MTPVPRWAVWSTLALSLSGLGISIYLTIVHFQPAALACSGGGAVDCARVLTSGESYFLGIPVAILGLAHYSVMTLLNTPWAWARPQRWLHQVRFALAFVGFGFILWLISAEVLIIHKICLWCTGVHVITLVLLIVLTRVSPQQLGLSPSNSDE